ncbi:MAG TPA: threonine-phosphate decarboxylase CobD [Sporosarcina sp.]|nr:threonine-phosphate decarboxylase CobD [Sporosarcina sp.]
MSLPSHGANPHRLYEQLQIDMPPIVYDFSENVNARGVPSEIVDKWPALIEKLSAYPDPLGEPFLSHIADFHQVHPSEVLIGNGAAEILMFIAERYRGKRAVIVHPTFSEYEATLRAKDVSIERVLMGDDLQVPVEKVQAAMKQADVLYLCTPNNPTGILPSAEVLTACIEYGKEVHCDIVLDEAFIDFVDENLSFIPKRTHHPHVIILRSMTKMFAIAGVRLGYAIADSAIIAGLRNDAPHWNVNGLAAEIGTLCLQAQSFIEQTKVDVAIEREKMQQFLRQHHCIVTESVANFLCFQLPDATQTRALYEDLLHRGIVLRHTENYEGLDGRWLRIGIKGSAQMTYLRKEMTRWFQQEQ